MGLLQQCFMRWLLITPLSKIPQSICQPSDAYFAFGWFLVVLNNKWASCRFNIQEINIYIYFNPYWTFTENVLSDKCTKSQAVLLTIVGVRVEDGTLTAEWKKSVIAKRQWKMACRIYKKRSSGACRGCSGPKFNWALHCLKISGGASAGNMSGEMIRMSQKQAVILRKVRGGGNQCAHLILPKTIANVHKSM